MVKLLALLKKTADAEESDAHVEQVLLPMMRQLPGVRSFEVTRLKGSLLDEARFALVMELRFDSQDSMDHALASPEGKAAAREFLRRGPQALTILHGDVE